MPLKGVKKKATTSTMRKMRKDNQQKRADYREDVEKSHADSVARCRESYMKDLEKSTTHNTA